MNKIYFFDNKMIILDSNPSKKEEVSVTIWFLLV